jgi:hypothetical protein
VIAGVDPFDELADVRATRGAPIMRPWQVPRLAAQPATSVLASSRVELKESSRIGAVVRATTGGAGSLAVAAGIVDFSLR